MLSAVQAVIPAGLNRSTIMSFVVLTDTSGNLQNRQILNNDLKVIPFPYYVDGKEYNCTDSDRFSGDSFYKRIREGLRVTTSQINPARYMAFFEPWLKAGKDIILVTMSSGISGACSAAHMAADTMLEKYRERRIERLTGIFPVYP